MSMDERQKAGEAAFEEHLRSFRLEPRIAPQQHPMVEPDKRERSLPEAGEGLMQRDPSQPDKPQPARSELMSAAYNAGWELRGVTLSENVASYFSFKSQPVSLYGQLMQRLTKVSPALSAEFARLNRGTRNAPAEAALVSRIAASEEKTS